MTEEQEEKYVNFLDKVSEILGLNKPVDVLRLCAVTDEYLRPIEKHIAELEKENTELIQENEEMKKGLGCETCQIHLEFAKLNQKITALEAQIEKMKCCGNCIGTCNSDDMARFCKDNNYKLWGDKL